MCNVQAMQAVEKLASESLRGLRKLGMRDEIDVLLRQMADVILQGEDMSTLSNPRTDRNWPVALRALLHVAAGWLYFGREKQAEPIISAARALLFRNELAVKEQAQLAKVYARTVGGAPAGSDPEASGGTVPWRDQHPRHADDEQVLQSAATGRRRGGGAIHRRRGQPDGGQRSALAG